MSYEPRKRPLVPVGHRTWLGVSRVKERTDLTNDNMTVDERIEMLLEFITRPGADQAQRHDDLVTLAELIIEARGNKVVVQRNTVTGEPTAYTWDGSSDWGYGVAPIDSDTHDRDCIICGPSIGPEGSEPDFDTHPYTYNPTD
jgi:hypothetical protein